MALNWYWLGAEQMPLQFYKSCKNWSAKARTARLKDGASRTERVSCKKNRGAELELAHGAPKCAEWVTYAHLAADHRQAAVEKMNPEMSE